MFRSPTPRSTSSDHPNPISSINRPIVNDPIIVALPCTPLSFTASHQVDSARSARRTKIIVLECDFPGCDHKGAFARKYELKRHMRSRHGADQTFFCGALGCFKRGTTCWTFPRLDKLTDHLRATHAHAAPFSGCPAKDCDVGPLPLDVLGAHVQRAHPNCVAEARSILNATTARRRKCPLSGCNNRLFSLHTFIVHLQGHGAEDIYAARSNWCFESLAFNFSFVSGMCNVAVTGVIIGIACPACSTTSSTFEQFQLHLWSSHLFVDSSQGAGHFLAWRDALTQVRGTFSGIVPWENSMLHHRHTIQCPQCMHSASDSSFPSSGLGTQHPGLMKPLDQIVLELGPVRMQILRLYPEFLTHPIFDDCA
jgi:hypothetical protein